MQHFPADLSNSRCWRAVLLCAVSGAAGGCDASSRIPSSISITSSSINLVMGQQPVSHCTVTLLYYCHCILWSNRMPEAIFYIYFYLESQKNLLGELMHFHSASIMHLCIKDFYFYETVKLCITPTFDCLSLCIGTLTLCTGCVLNIDLIRPVQL